MAGKLVDHQLYQEYMRAICMARGIPFKHGNIKNINAMVAVDKSLASFDEFINGQNTPRY